MRDRAQATAQAKELVSRMTLEEKASQLKYDAPAIPRLGIPAYNWWNEALHGVARAGTATVFPQAIGLAAMFDEELQEEIASVVSDEARAKYNGQSRFDDRDIYKGLTVWSPNINIFRDPRWGRGHETYGEDPYLTSRLGIRYIEGLQGHGKYLKTAACSKHFAVHSGPEALRHEFDAKANPKDMAETYLAAFEATVKEADVESVMGAYNRVNGEPACGSKALLKDTLRGKWGFRGHVVSDCWAIRDFHVNHKVTATAPESAALAIRNGCDLNCGNTYLHMKVLRLSALLHDIAKPICKVTDKNGVDHFEGHPVRGKEMAREILRRLKFDNDTMKRVQIFVRYHDERPELEERAIRWAVSEIGTDAFPGLFELKRADTLGQSEYMRKEKLEAIDKFQEIYQDIIEKQSPLTIRELAVNGKDLMELGVEHGPMMGEVLKRLLAHVLDNPEDNTKERLSALVRREML